MSNWIKRVGVYQDNNDRWWLFVKHTTPIYLGAGIVSDITEYPLKDEQEANKIMKEWCVK